MRLVKCFAIASGMALLVWAANGQQPGNGGGPKGGGKNQKGQNNTNSDQLVADMKLSDTQKTKARDILRAHDDKMRQAAREARQDLLAKMKEVLPEAEFKVFKEELDQVPLVPAIPAITRTVSNDDLMERLMAYDKKGIGKVTKEDLPERMHSLVDQGDRNGDGALDRDEIRRMIERDRRPGGGPGGNGPPTGANPPPRRPRDQ